MEYLILGHGGAPVLVFPTSNGRCWQWEDFSMVASLRRHLDNGWAQLFCVDSVDREALYNHEAEPGERLARQAAYEAYILEEFLPILRQENPVDYLIVTGTSFGAYHAVNFSLRHPDVVHRVIAMSGDYCIRKYLDDHYDLDAYFNCPVDYLPNLTDAWYLERYRNRLDIILATSDWDFCLGPTLRLSEILERLGVPHFLDVWGDHLTHDWPAWKRMIQKFL
ncbi:MAG: alpha/beta hydrolase-fold protein [Candidatus Eremiobacterota bacterium]